MKFTYKIGIIVLWQVIFVIGSIHFLTYLEYAEESTLDKIPKLPLDERIDSGAQQSLNSLPSESQNDDLTNTKLILVENNVPLNFVYYIIVFAVLSNILLIVIIVKIIQRETNQRIKYEKFVTIGELAARLSHDIRNPLSVINLGIHMLKDQNSVPEINKKYETILNSVNRIKHQVNDVLNHIRTNGLNIQKNSFKKIIENSLEELVVPKNVEVVVPQNDKTVYCDLIKIQTVITNIIHNAIQAIEEKGIIQIRLQENKKYVLCQIEDSGDGLKEEHLSKIFEPMFTTKQLGTGLGLSTCKAIVESHGGRISVFTEPTIFEISLLKKSDIL